jgi:hypothetical protein
MQNHPIPDENLLRANEFVQEISKLIYSKEVGYWVNNLPIIAQIEELKNNIRYHEETKLNNPRVSKDKIDRLVDIAIKCLNLSASLSDPSTDLQSAKHISIVLKATAQNILLLLSPDELDKYSKNNPEQTSESNNERIKKSQELLDDIEARIRLLSNQGASLENTFIETNNKINALDSLLQKQLELAKEKITGIIERTDVTSREKIENVSLILANMQNDINEKQATVLENYFETSKRLDEKSNELSKLSEELSNKALSGGYSVKGREELDKAESFRNGAFVMMLFIVGLLWYFTFHRKEEISVSDIALHISLIFGLFVPTTYFSRESGKHRLLGNKYLETGLYLTTLNPYMASMKDEEKNKIKTDLAGKLFFSFDNREQTDSMPINTQEVIMKAMDLASKAGRK